VSTNRLTPAEIRLAQYGERTSTWSTATHNNGTEKALHEIALGLKAEVDRLRTRVAELEEERRLEWLLQGLTPHTPRLCACGHSHHAHTVPAPHSCFAHGQTCPCPAYRQLPHDEAVAQLDRNRRAAAEAATPAP
jgi:hypothetical protein